MKTSYLDISQGEGFIENSSNRRIEAISAVRSKNGIYEADFWDSKGEIITIKSDAQGYFDIQRY